MRFFSPGKAAADAGQAHTIELNLHDTSQLFNSMDPSPFNEKDLDHDAEEFIMSWAQEFPPGAPVKLRIFLEQWPTEDPNEVIRQAVQNYFAHRATLIELEFSRLMKRGRTSLLIGVVFLAACLVVIRTLLPGEAGTWAGMLRESLTIAGWVAMWRPMQIYLYDWWPLRRIGRINTKLSHMPVEVIRQRVG
ncbi:MAG TPA: hypothetical protein VIJ45_00605 [Coriobacteriia bacterium]